MGKKIFLSNNRGRKIKKIITKPLTNKSMCDKIKIGNKPNSKERKKND